MNCTVSLIISTYNWPSALRLCMQSVLKQSKLPDEVIIADDGSTEETKSVIDSFRKVFPVPLIHVWQEDNGFQLAQIRNKAIAKASMDYIIQIDGDLILGKNFIYDHFKFRKKGTFVSGSRVMLGETISNELLIGEKKTLSILSRGVKNRSNGLRLPFLSPLLSNYKNHDIYYLRGCNMAFYRSDLLSVNGYSEDFIGWGREDNEIAAKLINLGVKKRIIKFSGIVYHIYHKEQPRNNLSDKDELIKKIISEKLVNFGSGVDKYL